MSGWILYIFLIKQQVIKLLSVISNQKFYIAKKNETRHQ